MTATLAPRTATVTAIAANLRAHRTAATAAQTAEGRAWYPAMGTAIREIAATAREATGDYALSDSCAIGVFCAYSQNSTWKANVTMATRYLTGQGQGGMRNVMAEIAAMEDGADPATLLGLKRSDFYRNLSGDMDAVTCDRWHLRAAYGADKVKLTAEVRAAVTAATAIVAAEFGESPAECQAVIWCAVRPSGDGK